MDLLYFILVSHGLTQILVYGKILNTVRPTQGFLGDLLSCTMCTGFWSGLFLWGTNDYTTLFNYDFSVLTGLSMACLSSGTSYILSSLFDDEGLRVSRGVQNQ